MLPPCHSTIFLCSSASQRSRPAPRRRRCRSWPAFLATLVYSSRALVTCWGCFGWQLPFGLHAAVQALHVGAASRLVGVVCAAPGAAGAPPGGTFMSLNAGKFRGLMGVLDWPFAVVWPPAPMELSAGTTDAQACRAVVTWAQLTLGWLLPTAALGASHAASWRGAGGSSGGGSGVAAALARQLPLVTFAAAMTIWCVARVAAISHPRGA